MHPHPATTMTLSPTLLSTLFAVAGAAGLVPAAADAQAAPPAATNAASGAIDTRSALSRAAAAAGAVVTPSGLVYRSIKDGSGAAPAATDKVRVHYRGTFPDGREFDSSIARGQPATFPLNRVIPCWTEGLQKMKVGGRAQLTCPAAIAYGERGAGNGMIPPGAVLQFEVELLAIETP